MCFQFHPPPATAPLLYLLITPFSKKKKPNGAANLLQGGRPRDDGVSRSCINTRFGPAWSPTGVTLCYSHKEKGERASQI